MSLINHHNLIRQVDPQGLASILLQQEVVRQRYKLSRFHCASCGVVRAYFGSTGVEYQVLNITNSGKDRVSRIKKRPLVVLWGEKLASGGACVSAAL
jgi:uncharacterized Zn finger protein